MTSTVELVIASCNRPHLLRQSLMSAQRCAEQCINADVKLVVSENSSTDMVREMLEALHPGVEVKARTPQLLAHEHINFILEECRADYLIIVHDDDSVMPDMLSRLVKELEEDPNLSAVACNALIINAESVPTGKTMLDSKTNLTLQNAEQLLEQYFGARPYNIVPFPAYLYRTKSIAELRFNEEHGGKHCDLSFLCSVAEQGPIRWINEPLYAYRVHESNDSGTYAHADRIALFQHLQATYNSSPNNDYLRQLRTEVESAGLNNKNTGSVALRATKKLNQLIGRWRRS